MRSPPHLRRVSVSSPHGEAPLLGEGGEVIELPVDGLREGKRIELGPELAELPNPRGVGLGAGRDFQVARGRRYSRRPRGRRPPPRVRSVR